jgi:single-strand DNA-binding protein
MTTTPTDAPAKVRYRTLVGNVTREPELRFSAKGTPWCTTGLAVNRRKRLDDGTYEDLPAEFFELVCFGDLAEHIAESLGKGDRVVTFGRLETDEWTAKNGEQRTTEKLVADDIGASLRFASVEVHRAERRGPSEDSSDGYGHSEEPF